MAAAPIYKSLSAKFAEMIRGGAFAAGDKLPSVRRSSREHKVSITTVLEAYRALETEGLVESHPRSGFIVKPPSLPAARPTPYKSKPVIIGTSSIFEAVMDSVENRKMVPFAGASPDESIIAMAKLPSIAAAVFRNKSDALRYTPPTGRRELRVALAKHLLGCGIKSRPDEIISTHGATEALSLALRASTKTGDLIALESPTYFGILNLVRDLKLRVIEIPVSHSSGMNITALETALKKHRIAACLVQPNFQNPIGGVMPQEEKRRLAKLSTANGFTIIEDDVFGELQHHGERLSSIALSGGDVIHCGSVSKTIAPGLRVGWIVPGRHFEKIKHLKTIQSPWNATLSELMTADFIDSGNYDRHLRRIRKIYAKRCADLRVQIIRHFPSAKVHSPSGGFVLWIEMPPTFDAEAFAVAAISRGISLMPGTFFSPSLGFKNCFRLTCGFPLDARMVAAVATLAKLARGFGA